MPLAVERATAAGLLVVTALCCMCIWVWTVRLEQRNEKRRDQLHLLRQFAADPSRLPVGPVAALDGLFVRRIVCRIGPCGPRLWFDDEPGSAP